ncbi:RHS repeat-associated core domain-containing protein [Pseudomonas sp. SDO55104_S430]
MPTSFRVIPLCRYHYDPLDRLVESKSLSQSAIQRFYCKTRLATEIHDTGQHIFFQFDEQLLAQQKHSDSSVGTSLLVTDQQRSVLVAIDKTRPHAFAYTPYGYRHAESSLLGLLGYNGERPDVTTGHYHLGNGYRQFNPILMRFNRPDSLSPFGKGGLNAYGYCAGNPPNRIDPSGRVSLIAMKAYLLGTVAKPYKPLHIKIQQEFGEMLMPLHRPQPPLTATEMVARRRRSAPSLIQFDNNQNPNFADTLIGMHGSDVKNHNSLIFGLDLDRQGRNPRATEGAGLYTSPFKKTAARYSRQREGGVLGVYTRNADALKRGRDIDFSAIESSDTPNDVQVIIRANAFSRVHVKRLDVRDRVIFPRSHEAPF